MICEICGSDLRAGRCKLPIWGVPTVSSHGLKAHYFCSEQHGNDWIGNHPEYATVFGVVIDEKDKVQAIQRDNWGER